MLEALFANNAELAIALLKRGANPNIKPFKDNHNALEFFIEYHADNTELFDALLSAGLQFKFSQYGKEDYLNPPLAHFVSFCPQLVPSLLNHGLNPNLKVDQKPLLYWLITGKDEFIEEKDKALYEEAALCLLKAGAKSNIKVAGETLREINRKTTYPIQVIDYFEEQQTLKTHLPHAQSQAKKSGLRL